MMQPTKRKYYRLAVEAPCLIKIVQEGHDPETAPPFKGIVKDISEGGVLINTDRLQEKGVSIFPEESTPHAPKPRPAKVLIRFSLPHEKDPFVVSLLARWYDDADLSDPYEYHIGGQINRIGKTDLERLQQYLHKYGQAEESEEFQRRYRFEDKLEAGASITGKGAKFFDVVLPLRYRIISPKTGKSSNFCRTTTHQISLSGLNTEVPSMNVDGMDMVFDDTPMKRNVLEMEIALPGQMAPLPAIGEVHWVERFPCKDGYKYFVGIRFLKIDRKDLGLLARYLKGRPEAEDMATRGA